MLQPILERVNAWQEQFLRYMLTSVVPQSVQCALRDLGMFKLLSDVTFYSAGMALGLLRPDLLIEFAYSLFCCKRIQYGDRMDQFALTLPLLKAPTSGSLAITQAPAIRPILIFVHGGAWGSGRPWQYLLVAKRLGALLDSCFVAVVGYPVYPAASILQQRDCILRAVQYFRHQHLAEHNLDPDLHPIVLCGHSSGANIALLAAMEGDSAKNEVEVFIGLGGVYDIRTHFAFESNRGVQFISPMAAAAGGIDGEGFDECSPRVRLHRHLSGEISLRLLPKHFILLHGRQDGTVPMSASVEMADLLRQNGQTVTLCCPDSDHLFPLIDLVDLLPPKHRPAVLTGPGEVAKAEKDSVTMLANAWLEYMRLIEASK